MPFLLTLVRALASLLLFSSVILNFANIVGRYVLHISISWAEEGMLLLMVGAVFLGSVPVAWTGSHIRMDAVVQLLPVRIRDALAFVADLAFMVAAIALVFFAYPTLRQLIAFDQRSLAADIPLAIPEATIPLGLLLMAFVVAVRILSGRWRWRVAISTVSHERIEQSRE